MFGMKLKWYPLFESESELENLFAVKKTAVHKSIFGEVLLVKNDSGYHAFKNKCAHQNKPLNGCWTEDNSVVCPFHKYHFDIDSGQGHGTYIDKYELRFVDAKVEIGKEIWSIFN
ncbi:Rieske (2Fe-2S) protein [Crocinitomicaceae bacterium]|nr:Rieske (2Fe-2S) protein [Crocinitomicaceae bacterium]